MFPAYSAGGAGPSKQIPGPPTDLDSRTRNAIQVQAKKNLRNERNQTAEDHEDSVFQQPGFGESSSDDECGGVKMDLIADRVVKPDIVFTLPEKLKSDYGSRGGKQNKTKRHLTVPFETFPNRPPRDSYGRDDEPMETGSESNWGRSASVFSTDSRRRRSRSREIFRSYRRGSRSRSRSRETSRSRRERSRSRETSRSRRSNSRESRYSESSRRSSHHHKKKKSKKDRRRSSESSDSESSSSRRRRVPSPRRGFQMQKYEFLKLENEKQINCLSAQNFYRHTKFDAENYSLGCPKREIATIHLGFYKILGLEKEHDLFDVLYGGEVRKIKEEHTEKRDFFKRLIEVAAHVPSETFFRINKTPAADFWKLVKKKDILNQDETPRDADSAFQLDGHLAEINAAKQAVRDNITDAEALSKLIKLEEESARQAENRGSFIGLEPRVLAERHLSMVEKAIKASRMVHTLQLIKCDLMKKACFPVEEILKEHETICEKFPHEPICWVRYLDYVQYDSNVYSAKKMKFAFDLCLQKVEGLAHQTLLSHVGHVKDWPAFRYFHLAVYMRFLKWLLTCGQIPLVLANIQATMEYNLGLESIADPRDREEKLYDFWITGLPRIGDIGGAGAHNLTICPFPDGSLEKFRKEAYYDLLDDFQENIRAIFGDREASEQQKWVNFERKMLELDGKCKRYPFKDSEAFKKASKTEEDINMFEMWEYIHYGALKVFKSSAYYENLDYLQPMLELLGVKFLHSSGCFTTSEQVISEWIPRDIFVSSHANFQPTPTHSESVCLDVGRKILKFLIKNRHEITQKSPRVLDPILIRYILALIEMKFQERNNKLQYYNMKSSKVAQLVQDVFVTDEEIKTILEAYPRMKHSMVVIVLDKLTTWFEMGMAEERELEKLIEIRERMELPESEVLKSHIVTDISKQNLRKFQEKLWATQKNFLVDLDKYTEKENGKPKALCHPTIDYPILQIQLYSRILQARNYILDEKMAKSIRVKLSLDVMYGQQEKVIQGMDDMKTLHPQMKKEMETLIKMIKNRDLTQAASEGIPEFPRAGALCDAMEIALDFVFLDQIRAPRQSIIDMTQRIMQKCDEFDKSQMDWQRGDGEKYRDRVDLQFILETAITFFSQNDLSVTYNKNYENVILRASNTFSCETKYMKRLAEIFSTNRFQWMKIRSIIADRNKELIEKSKSQFNIQIERRLLQNTMTTMFTTMRICEKIGDGSRVMLFENWKETAMEIHDSAVWRMVMDAAERVGKKAVEQTFIRANGQCQWSLNLQLDYVEKMPGTLTNRLVHILEITEEQGHGVFIEDLDLLTTLHEMMPIRFQTERIAKIEELDEVAEIIE